MQANVKRIARIGWPVLAGALLGLAAGAIWTFAQPDRYRAEARVLIRGVAASRVMPAVQALAESSLLEQNIAQTLRMSHPPEIVAKTGKGGVLRLSTEAGSRERARQLDAEAAVVLTRLIAARFGDTRVEATVLDPAHAAGRTSPNPGRNFAIAGLIGLAVGIAAAIALAQRREVPMVAGVIDPAVERRLKARIDAVTKRERALARRAGELAAREQALEERASQLADGERQLEQREQELAAAPAAQAPSPPPEREPEPAPVRLPEPEPRPEPREPVAGRWNLLALESLVREHGSPDAPEYDEWNTYLFFLREHAGPDGTLPQSFDSLVNDVFGALVDREASSG